MARAAIAAGKAVRVRVDEFRFAARHGRAFAVGDARIDGERRGLRFASELDRLRRRTDPTDGRDRDRARRARADPDRQARRTGPPPCSARSRAPCRRLRESRRRKNRPCSRGRAAAPTYTVTPMPLSRLYAIVSTSPLRTVTLWPTACDTSVSAAVAPPARAASSTAAATRSSAAVDTGKCDSPCAGSPGEMSKRWRVRRSRRRSS